MQVSRKTLGLNVARVAIGILSAVSFFGVASSACSSKGDQTTTSTTSSSSSGGFDCDGGVVTDAGDCVGKCDPSICNTAPVTDNVCVNNQCALQCTSDRDCLPDGTQDCVAATDDTGASVQVCQPNGKPPGFGVPCPFGNECAQFGVCPDGSGCNLAECNNNPDDCKNGMCSDGSACAVATCAAKDCKAAFVCHGTGIPGDADAYCTELNCKTDADCAGGFTCGEEHAVEGTGANATMPPVCGETSANKTVIQACDPPAKQCVTPDKDGQYSQGQFCTEQTICLKRDACRTCKSDLDCSLFDNESCQMVAGEQRCVVSCSTSKDCARDYECTSGHCIPRDKDGCTAKTPGFCTPCRDDSDCGDDKSHFECLEVDSLSHERGCFDLSKLNECKSTADCPTSPSGKHGACLDESWGLTPASCTPIKTCSTDSDCKKVGTGLVCDDTTKICRAGCRGMNGTTCVGSSVCSSVDATIGACTVCATDTDCGSKNSGVICDATTKTCVDGCRGANGNFCPSGLTCSSKDATAGQCLECSGQGEVCDDKTKLCVAGCRGLGPNSCPNGLTCSSTTETPGQCSTCTSDSDCGGPTSGAVCNMGTCVSGCRGTGGNGCDTNAGYTTCTSLDNTIGDCLQCSAGNFFCYHTCFWPGTPDTHTSCW